jgi:hypothetical protein
MAEKTVLVCDVCGQPANQSVTIHAGSRRLVKDLCAQHVSELTKGARPVRRGRPRASAAAVRAKSTTAKSAKRPARRRRPSRKAASAA